jgi:biopolymer transport protein ExbD
MRKQKPEDYMSGNLTAMIDVVFQLIIFFVCTTSMQDSVNMQIQLAIAPHGKPIEKKDPREVKIDVDAKGNIYLARTQIGPNLLKTIVKKAVAEYGQDTPVVIRGDAMAKHSSIETAMNACTEAGIYKIKFAVLKEKGR